MEQDNHKSGMAKAALEKYVRGYKIFIDTCSLLHDKADRFWDNVRPMLKQYQGKIIVPLRVWEEIEKHADNAAKPELAERAAHCLETLRGLREEGCIELRGEATDNFADNVFQVVFTKFRVKYNLLLITQDKALAKDILAINDSRSVKTAVGPILVKQINQYGFLQNIFQINKNTALSPNEKFRICKEVTTQPDTLLDISDIPTENESVYTADQKTIKLTQKLGTGGEATVYGTDTAYVAKIYNKEKITIRKYEKIKLMLTRKIECRGICYPTDILYNSQGQFVGYLMPKAKGIELQTSVFGPKPLFLKKFPNWKKKDTVELCITILEKIKYLHDRNIIMGDINPANILVVSPKEVYFVDADSYQIEDFPCPVGTVNFTAPEIQRKHFPDFLRTMGNENFAIATLLFMIMLPGKPPYSQQGGADPVSNILRMDFSYPFKENTNKKTPEGPWRYIWSHLTYDLKEAFYHTFRKGGKNSEETSRLSVDDWLRLFVSYLKFLQSGKCGAQDSMSEELFPTRLKKNSQSNPIVYSGVCKECGRTFTMTEKEQEYYMQKGLMLPKRCPECRVAKKNTDKRQIDNRQVDSRKGDNSGTSASGSTGGCFISTAVCEYYGKSDDCEELTVLRNYRDGWLRRQGDGEALIAEYYRIAPAVVDALKSSQKFSDHCRTLWRDYIQPCVGLIRSREYARCKELYIAMVRYAVTLVDNREI